MATQKAAEGIGGPPSGRPPRQHLRSVIVAVLLIGCPAAAAGPPDDDAPKQVRRLRGIIDQDDTWAGHVIITGDLQVFGATVTIRAGALVEFADAATDGGPTLTVGSPKADGGALRIMATPKEPVTFRTRSGTRPGRIIVYLHNRRVASPRTTGDIKEAPIRATSQPATLTWRHIRFEQLGGVLNAPAITIDLLGTSQNATITDCELTQSARLLIKAGDRATVTISNNRFRKGRSRVALEVLSDTTQGKPAAVSLAQNNLTAAILVDGPSAKIQGNTLVGINASIVVRGDASPQTVIEGNYVHNTTTNDDGRYCLSTENPDARIENNILRGGSVCVLHGSRRMAGNVIIAAPRIDRIDAKPTPTRELVASLPHGARFERNILLGPAHSMLVPQPAGSRPDRKVADTIIHVRHNTFDGFGTTTRAIHLNPAGRLPARVSVAHNLFLRVRSLVFDESRTRQTLNHADHNAYAPPPLRLFDRAAVVGVRQGQPGWSASDIERQTPTQLGLPPALRRLPKANDDGLLSGTKAITALRAEYEALYRPEDDSPLADVRGSQQIGAIPPDHGRPVAPQP